MNMAGHGNYARRLGATLWRALDLSIILVLLAVGPLAFAPEPVSLPGGIPAGSAQECAAKVIVAGRVPNPHGRYDEVAQDLVSQPSLELLPAERIRVEMFEGPEVEPRRLIVTLAVDKPAQDEKSYVVPVDLPPDHQRVDAVRIGGRVFWLKHHPFMTLYPQGYDRWDAGIYLVVGEAPSWQMYLGLRRVGYLFKLPEPVTPDTDYEVIDPTGTILTRVRQ